MFGRRVAKMATNFEEILSRPHGNFKLKKNVFEPSIVFINYCVIVINAYYCSDTGFANPPMPLICSDYGGCEPTDATTFVVPPG
jgi:hypothetical protein